MIDVSLIVNIVAALGAILAVITALYVHWDSSSPDVQVFLESDYDKGCSAIVVKNYGKKPAYDIEIIDFDYSLVQPAMLPKVKASFISRGVPMLAPNQQRKTIITENEYASSHFYDACIQGNVAFKKKSVFGKRKLQNTYALDYYSFAHSLFIHSDIHQIKKSLESISNSLAEMSNAR